MPLDHPSQTAIIGAGLMGSWHARYGTRCGAEIVAVVAPDRARAHALAAEYPGAEAYRTLSECLVQRKLHVAHVCAPTDQHFALCSQAIGAGLHTLVEKPAASDAALTQELLTMARSRGLSFAVSLQLPFQAGFEELLEQRQSLGDPVRIEFRAATAGGDDMNEAERRRLLWEILPHPLSVFVALSGAEAWETNWRADRSDDQELELSAVVAGVPCAIFLSLRERPRALELEWRGTQGRAEVDFYHGYAAIHRGTNSRADKLGRPFKEAAVGLQQASANLVRRALGREAAYPGLSALISKFYASINGGAPAIAEEAILGIARAADAIRSQGAP